MLKHLLNDTAVLKTVSGCNEYNVPDISEVKTIRCKTEFISEKNDSERYSLTASPLRLFCEDTVKPGDIINYQNIDREVIKVAVYTDFEGNKIFCEVYLK